MVDTELLAPDGDVILVVGSTAKRFRVSSEILTAASPVFKTMLGPNFREGQQPRSSTEPVEVSLPEDDPGAMQGLCRLLHLDVFNTADTLTLGSQNIFGIVVLADKYDAVTAIRWQARSALLSWLLNNSSKTDMVQVGHIVAAAYLICCSTAFEKATSHLITRAVGPLSSLLSAPFNTVLPAKILGEYTRYSYVSLQLTTL